MSLLNMLVGTNPFASILLGVLGFKNAAEEIPRLRDCFVDSDKNIVVFTRTGGGNREAYAEQNASLEERDGFVRTEDWVSDSTYALWVYTPKPVFADLVREIAENGGEYDMTEKFEAALAALSGG